MIDNPFVTNGEFCENGPLKTEKWSANNKKFISRPKSSFGRGHFFLPCLLLGLHLADAFAKEFDAV